MTPSHDCAQVERDALALHEALAEAIRRLTYAREFVRDVIPQPGALALSEMLRGDDLLAVLERTSQRMPTP